MKNFKIGNKIIIKAKVSGLKPNARGVITNIDGSYFLVLPEGRKKGEEVELYHNEIENIKEKMKKVLKNFTINAVDIQFDTEIIDSKMDKLKIDANDIISITTYHSGPYHTYTFWYKKSEKGK